MNHSEILRRARERLGFSVPFCALKCGLSTSCYFDVEAHDDEFFSNISLGTARRICNLLQLDILDLTSNSLGVAILERSCSEDVSFFSRNALILAARLKLKMNEEKLGNTIGFGTETVELLEKTPDFIETIPLNVVIETAAALRIDPGLLICRR